jgi:hypothetical protein
MSKLYIVTVVTESKYYFPYLVESCKRHNGQLTVLGFNQKWQGFTWRTKLMLDFLKKIDPNDVVCFVDGYDVICTRNLNELKDEFLKIKKQTNCKIIVGHDKNYSIFARISLTLLFGMCKNTNINAGTYIGLASDLLIILKNIYTLSPYNEADDQVNLIKYCNLVNNNDIYIDVPNTIFLTLAGNYNEIDKVYKIKINENKELIYQNNKPFFLHGPGVSYLDNTIKLLGYDLNTSIRKQLKQKFYENAIFQIKSYTYLYILIILLFLIIYFIK